MNSFNCVNKPVEWSGVESVSMGATSQSDPVHVTWIGSLSVTATVSSGSSPSGTLTLEGSNDNFSSGGEPNSPAHWVTITGASASVSADGDIMIDKAPLCFNWFRLVYTRTSGDGTLAARFTIKGGI